MKNSIKWIVTILLVAGVTTAVKPQTKYQAKATTAAGAEIVTAIALTSDGPLNFGKMSTPKSAVDVILSTGHVVTASDQTAISLFTATATNAQYTVNGASGYNYTISLPNNDEVSISAGSNSMKINDFKALVTSNPNGDGTTGTLSSGSDTFLVGATLKVNSDQAAGQYTGNFEVIVSYN